MNTQVGEWWNSVSLRSKITGVTVLVLAFGILVAGVGTMAILKPTLDNQLNERLTSSASALASNDQFSETGQALSEYVNKATQDYFIVLYAPESGSARYTNWREKPVEQRPTFPSTITAQDAANYKDRVLTLTDGSGSQEYRAVVLPLTYAGDGNVGAILVAASTHETDSIIATYLSIFFGLGLGVILLGAGLTRVLVTSTFAPLHEVEHTAAAIAEGDFSQRLAVSTPNTEVGRLNRSLNTMLNRIDRALSDRAHTIAQMRRFVGDASHELRTPLVTVRGYAELYRMGALQTDEDVAAAMGRIEKEAIRMGALVEDLLELARLDETKPLMLAPVDLSMIARDAVMDARTREKGRTVTLVADSVQLDEMTATGPNPFVQAGPRPPLPGTPGTPEPGVALTAPIAEPVTTATAAARLSHLWRGRRPRKNATGEVPTIVPPHVPETVPELAVPAIVLAEENKLRQVVTNLVGNAMRFTSVESPVEVGVSANATTGIATLAIIDHGDGIPSQIREKIFQRFWRADNSRTRETGGSGLGLAIVASIVGAHQGSVTVTETAGGGATFRVFLPLHTPAPDTAESTPEA